MTNAPAAGILDDLKQLLRWFATLFGEPRQIREDAFVRRKTAAIMRGWLVGLEAIARALLVVMAAGLPKPEPRKPGKKRRRSAATMTSRARPTLGDPLTEAFADAPPPESESWAGVCFRLVPPARPERRAGRRRGAPREVASTRGMAFRLEALIRVAEAPERFARRMARRLARGSGVAFRILRQPAPIGCESFPRSEVGRAQGLAWLALDAPPFGSDTG